ncbi:MAG: YdcF family protein [Oscillospiraceae bacterium]|nr:YdcF family protein [Oscillospiraceae bacterium]
MKRLILLILVILLCLLGLIFCFALLGYEFLAYALWGIAAVIGIYWLFFQKKLKLLRRIFTGILAIGLLAAGITGTQIAIAAQGDPAEDCPYLLVLGAGINGTEPSLALKSRLDAAYDYMTEHPDCIAIVSGGQNEDEVVPESEVMEKYLLSKGISAQRIWQEDKSTSTRENFLFSLELIVQKTGHVPKELNVVSNEFHLYRVGKIAESLDLTCHGIPAKTPYPLLLASCSIREILAVWYYQLRWSIG